jgi:hypothetical protein
MQKLALRKAALLVNGFQMELIGGQLCPECWRLVSGGLSGMNDRNSWRIF